MNILNICTSFPPAPKDGGPPIAAHAVARELIGLGHDVFTITLNQGKAEPLKVPQGLDTVWREVPVRYCRSIKLKPFFSWEMTKELRRRISQYDICLARGNWAYVNFLTRWMCNGAKVPYVVYPEGSFDPWAINHHAWKKSLWWTLVEKANYRKAAAVIALTKIEALQIRQMGINGRVDVIPNGVDPAELQGALSRPALEELFPALKTGPFILFLGRVHEKKGLHHTLQAMALLPQRFEEVKLAIAGPDEGGYRTRLEVMARELGLASRLIFTGPVTGKTKAGLLKEARLFVLNSLSEGLPIAALEAMACGTPVLLSPFCNLPEVAAAKAGLIVPLEAEKISQGIERLLGDGEAHRQLSENARLLIAARFNWRQIGKLTEKLCTELARQE
jgi:glycosyltransferase involved in cell wall biosynthesis